MNAEIERNIDSWVSTFLPNLVFRQYQKETITSIIESVIDSEACHNQIIEAPTGSGKSIICIVAAGVLDKYYNKKSYILCSDLYLWNQYAKFIEENNLPFGYLKGLTGNYTCAKNSEDLRNAACRMARIPWTKLFDDNCPKEFECAKTCQYVKARKRATRSNVCLMTYQLFMYQRNVTKSKVFTGRDVLFLDECHNIPDIVQNQCSPSVSKENFKHYLKLFSWAIMESQNMTLFDGEKDYSLVREFRNEKELAKYFDNIYSKMRNQSLSKEEDWHICEEYFDILCRFLEIVEDIEDLVEEATKYGNINKEDLVMYREASYLRNHRCFWEDFMTSVKLFDNMLFVKDITLANTGEESIQFHCVKEDFMTWHFLFSHTPNRIMLSATVGGKEAFDENVGILHTEQKKSEMTRIPSTFNFDTSPVYCIEKYKMSYDEKEKSFPKIEELIYKILERETGRGIIQTGSYENAKKLWLDAPVHLRPRILTYNDSKEKEQIINEHQMYTNSVLAGPSLNEGIDLPGDKCSFIIILKVPYPNLADKLVKAKMEAFPKWYKAKTSNSIIQGIGRGNRFIDDESRTYILDGCFKQLFYATKSQYSNELQKRLKFYC